MIDSTNYADDYERKAHGGFRDADEYGDEYDKHARGEPSAFDKPNENEGTGGKSKKTGLKSDDWREVVEARADLDDEWGDPWGEDEGGWD